MSLYSADLSLYSADCVCACVVLIVWACIVLKVDAVQVGSARCNLHGAAFWLLTDKGNSSQSNLQGSGFAEQKVFVCAECTI